ncbi:MAG: hypothetical protein PHI60_00290 [Candidatus Omnitrophica bacterium]|nr:hypothetical protein [Candidatus Omnitrophota bacterium]
MATVVLSVLLGGFFLKTVNENNFANRYAHSVRAFWAAEAGLSTAMKNLPKHSTTGSVGGCGYSATTTFRAKINHVKYYDIVSTGTVNLPRGGSISRTVTAVVKTGSSDPAKFQYSIQAANELCFGGNCSKDPYLYIEPSASPYCNDHDCFKDMDGTLNFSDMLGYQLESVSGIATHYTRADFPMAVSGVNWVDVEPGETLMVDSSATGSGVLVIDGNVEFAGGYHFYGVIWVLGTLRARGTFDAYGSVIIASTAGIDSINGDPMFHWSPTDVEQALEILGDNFADTVSWYESS